jgi:hypothetical protein
MVLSSLGIVGPQWKRVIYRARIPDEIEIKVETLMQVSLLEKRVDASWNRTSAAQNPHAERLEKRRRRCGVLTSRATLCALSGR